MGDANADTNLMAVLIILILILISKQLYDLYKKYSKDHHEVYFVMGDSNCCNPNENPTSKSNINQCQKYCAKKVVLKIRNRIGSSKSSICIAMYNFSNHLMADYVLGAHRRGIKIRLLIDKSACESPENRTQARRLKNAGMFECKLRLFLSIFPSILKPISCEFTFSPGIPVRVSGENEKLMHNKFCLIDGTNARGVLITGSLNWTYGVSRS